MGDPPIPATLLLTETLLSTTSTATKKAKPEVFTAFLPESHVVIIIRHLGESLRCQKLEVNNFRLIRGQNVTYTFLPSSQHKITSGRHCNVLRVFKQ